MSLMPSLFFIFQDQVDGYKFFGIDGNRIRGFQSLSDANARCKELNAQLSESDKILDGEWSVIEVTGS